MITTVAGAIVMGAAGACGGWMFGEVTQLHKIISGITHPRKKKP
jgi:hypothetical protein